MLKSVIYLWKEIVIILIWPNILKICLLLLSKEIIFTKELCGEYLD